MTLEELDKVLPNGFHDAKIFSLELDYLAGTAKLRMGLLARGPDSPTPDREAYKEGLLVVSGLCFCSIEPPSSTYHFLPNGRPIQVSGDAAKADHLPSLPDLTAKFPVGTWCYRFFVVNWNAFIHIAGRNAEVKWIGEKSEHR